MLTFKLVEDENGIIEEVRFSDNTTFKNYRDLEKYMREGEKRVACGEGLHNLAIGLKAAGLKFRLWSNKSTGLTMSLIVGRTKLIDISGWNYNTDVDIESVRRVEQIAALSPKLAAAPTLIVNNDFREAMGWDEASDRALRTPILQDGWMCSSRLPNRGFKPAYGGGLLATPADPRKIYENVFSYDISSCYPYSAIAASVPRSKSVRLPKDKISSLKITDGMLNIDSSMGFIAIFNFKNTSRKPWVKLPMIRELDKNFVENAVFDRIGLVSGTVRAAFTPYDLRLFCLQYDYEEVEIVDMTIHKLGSIPEKAKSFILNSYDKKNNLPKGSAEREAAKTALNTIIGFWGSDPFKTMIKSELSKEDGVLYEKYEGSLKDHFEKYAGKDGKVGHAAGRARTWDFRWAAYITAHSRLRLGLAEKLLHDRGIEVLYCDTDSIKMVGDSSTIVETFKELNEEVIDTLDYNRLGLWEDESDDFAKAVFRGLKVYATIGKDGKNHSRIAGMSLEDAAVFTEGMSLEDFADEKPLVVTIHRRSPADITNDPFGFKLSYALREIEIKY